MFQGDYAESEQEATEWVNSVIAGEKAPCRRPPELLTRDVVARAIRREVRAGRGSPHGGVFLDIASRRTAEAIKKKLPSMYHQFKELADVDITTDPMEVGPTCHYTMGGIRVDPDTQETTIGGLYACGEVSGGMHGSNRLGGNSLSDLLVFGKRAGEFAAQSATEHSFGSINETEVESLADAAREPFGREGGENPFAVHEDLRSTMQNLVGIVRTKDDLEQALEKISELRDRAGKVSVTGNMQFNPGWHLALDLWNMLDISEVVTRAALKREESRGGHTREDFPDSDAQWGKFNQVARQTAGEIQLEKTPLPEMPEELKKLLED
jgi:succinate dehydrogenase / fumarate reductase flavoprotein subunit